RAESIRCEEPRRDLVPVPGNERSRRHRPELCDRILLRRARVAELPNLRESNLVRRSVETRWRRRAELMTGRHEERPHLAKHRKQRRLADATEPRARAGWERDDPRRGAIVCTL